MHLPKLAKRMFGLMAATALAGCAQTTLPQAAGATPAQAAAERPNVLFILVDDLKPALGAFGDPYAISPNIDALAARGTRFEHAYANQAVCAPSRINLMTGTRSTSTGIYHFGMDLRDYIPNAVTLPERFKQAGYHTEAIGKVYHVGHGSNDDPASWSIPSHKDKVVEYLLRESTGGQPTREEALFYEVPIPDGQDVFAYARTLQRGAAFEAPDVPDDAYADGRVARYAADRLARLKDAEEPFFLAVGFARPHLPFSVPKKYWDLYDPQRLPLPDREVLPEGAPKFAGKIGGEIVAYKPVPEGPGKDYPEALKRRLMHGYYAGVSYVDAQIGYLLDALEAQGLRDDTIVVLWGDHGYHLGDHGLWTKHTNYEQAVRQAMILAGPGTGGAARAPDHVVETVDLYPTLLELAGISMPNGAQRVDGESIVPVLRGQPAGLENFAYHSFNRPDRIGQAIRTERYRLVRWTHEKTGKVDTEFYDLEADPGETRNLAGTMPEVEARLAAILDAQPEPKSVDLRHQHKGNGQ